MITSDATAADPNSTGLFLEIDAILAVVIGGTSLAGGRFSLGGTVIGAFIIQTMTMMILILGIAPGDHARVQGRRRGGRVPHPVTRGAPRSLDGRYAGIRRTRRRRHRAGRPTDSSSTLGAEPLPDVTELVDVANSVQRESS